MLKKRGVAVRLLDVPGAPPIIYGELKAASAKHTLILYAHYDGQPVDAAQWSSPPWTPVLREENGKPVAFASLPEPLPGEWRIYARSASDDKAPIQAMLSALDALRAANVPPAVNLKFFFEGEEEAGSPHLAQAIRQYADLLRGDAWILCDGPVHQTRRMQLYFGARGITDVEMTVYGPARPLHSGHYGNWAPNPAVLLAELLASMRDREARIKIAGFYDDVRPLTDSERQAIRQAPAVDAKLMKDLGLAWTEGGDEPLLLRLMMPALNVRGIESGHVGEKAQNAIPTAARASVDFRLVPDQRPERMRASVEDHIRKQGFYIVREFPSAEERRAHPRLIQLAWGAGYPAARVSMDLPVAQAVTDSIEAVLGGPVIRLPMLGGSVPLYLFPEVLKTPVIGVPIVNHDNNQHAADENLRLQNLWDGIEILGGLFADVENHWK